MGIIIQLLLLLFLHSFSNSLAAREVSIQLDGGLYGLAEFTQGRQDKPAVLILHGILQTRDFTTVRRIGDFLDASGFTTLRPTISLGIDSRRKGLACEAIHTHTMQQDVEEIARWVEWLKNKTGQPIILIGHSAGASQLVAYLDKYKGIHEAPQKILFISLAYFGNRPSSYSTTDEIERARQAIRRNQLGLARFGFAYCQGFVTLPLAYLSYMEWSKDRVSEVLSTLNRPVSLLFGSGDKRVDQEWPAFLKQRGMDVRVIDGADHFFHGVSEFDLLDFIEDVLQF